VRRVLEDKAAVNTWLLTTLAGIVVALVSGHGLLAVLGWVFGGIAAVVLVAVRTRRER
jgi:hypothetical protein